MAKPVNLRIEDVAAATARADLNDILISIASLQTTDGAGAGYTGEPTTTYPNMLWYDKATDILKMRSEADDAWITVGNLNQAANTFAAAVALASQAEAEAGTENTKTMTPLRTKQAIDALVPAALNATGSAPVYACRAWVNFNGVGTVSIRASGNVSSVTDNAVGDYTVNFTTAMPDANYAVVGTAGYGGDGRTAFQIANIAGAYTTSSVRVGILNHGNLFGVDSIYVNVAIFR